MQLFWDKQCETHETTEQPVKMVGTMMKQWLEDLLRDPEIRLRAKNNSKDDFMKYFEVKLKCRQI